MGDAANYTGMTLEERSDGYSGQAALSHPRERMRAMLYVGRMPAARDADLGERSLSHIDLGLDIIRGTNITGFFPDLETVSYARRTAEHFTDDGRDFDLRFYQGFNSALFEVEGTPLPSAIHTGPEHVNAHELFYHVVRGYVQARATTVPQSSATMWSGVSDESFRQGRLSASRLFHLLGYAKEVDSLLETTALDAFLENERVNGGIYDVAKMVLDLQPAERYSGPHIFREDRSVGIAEIVDRMPDDVTNRQAIRAYAEARRAAKWQAA